MFCHKCGYKLTNNNIQCSNCRAVSEKIEVCGGFWGLVGEERKEPVGVTTTKETIINKDKEILEKVTNLQEKVDNVANKQQKSIYVTYGLMVLIIAFILVINLMLLNKLDALKDFNKKYFNNLEEILITESVSREQKVQEEIATEVITTEAETTESETIVSDEPATEPISTEAETTALEPITTETVIID